MKEKNTSFTERMLSFVEAATIDLPVAAVSRIFSEDADKDFHQAGWKVYDAAIGAAIALTDSLYTSPRVGRAAANVIERSLVVQRTVDAVAGAFFGSLWPSIGLPTNSEVKALRSEVRAIREELRSARMEQRLRERQAAKAAPAPAPVQRNNGLPLFLNPLWAGWANTTAGEVKSRVSL